jgi:hypothetical protein
MPEFESLKNYCSVEHREIRHDGREYDDQFRIIKKAKKMAEAMQRNDK